MANKNTNPVGGKTAVPADINNAQPAYFPKPHHTWEGQRPRCPQPQPEAAENAKNQTIRKNSTIPQSDFHSSWGPTPEFLDEPSRVAHSVRAYRHFGIYGNKSGKKNSGHHHL